MLSEFQRPHRDDSLPSEGNSSVMIALRLVLQHYGRRCSDCQSLQAQQRSVTIILILAAPSFGSRIARTIKGRSLLWDFLGVRVAEDIAHRFGDRLSTAEKGR